MAKKMQRTKGLTYAQKMQAAKLLRADIIANKVNQMTEDSTQRALWCMCVAMNKGLGIGKKRFYRDFLPEFEKINAKYDEFYKADGNREYADLWLKREVAAITDEDVKIGEEDFTI